MLRFSNFGPVLAATLVLPTAGIAFSYQESPSNPGDATEFDLGGTALGGNSISGSYSGDCDFVRPRGRVFCGGGEDRYNFTVPEGQVISKTVGKGSNYAGTVTDPVIFYELGSTNGDVDGPGETTPSLVRDGNGSNSSFDPAYPETKIEGTLGAGDYSVRLRNPTAAGSGQFELDYNIDVETEASDRTVFLDFEGDVRTEFIQKTDSAGNLYYDTDTTGTHPGVDFDALARSQIEENLQSIFDASGTGVTIDVTRNAPDDPAALNVEFGAPLPELGGMAYDVQPRDLNAVERLQSDDIDRFDRRKGGSVAVLTDADANPFAISEVAAHEIGHAFGLFHVEGDPQTGGEIMDYDFAEIPEFPEGPSADYFDRVTNRFDFANDRIARGRHNPSYHLQRYVIGRSDSALKAEGIDPGDWDTGTFSLNALNLRLLPERVGAYDWFMVTGDAAFGSANSYAPLDPVIDDNGLLPLQIAAETSFGIVGQSPGAAVIDTFLGTEAGTGFGEPLSFTKLLEEELALFQLDAGATTPERLAAVAVERAGPAPAPIPGPASLPLLATGLVFAAALRRRRGSRRRS